MPKKLIALGDMKRIVSGRRYCVYHRQSVVNGRIVDRMWLRSVTTPHNAMKMDADNLDDAIQVLEAAKKVRDG